MTKRNLLGAALLVAWSIIGLFWSNNPNAEFALGLTMAMLSFATMFGTVVYIIYFYGNKISRWWKQLPNK